MSPLGKRVVLVVDSSVWIDFFNGANRPATRDLSQVLQAADVRLVVPDLVLFEVLRGFRLERDYRQARSLFDGLDIEPAGGRDIALQATQHYRALRLAGITVRKAVDVLVASFCIERDYALLASDRDYLPFATLRGLKIWPAGGPPKSKENKP